MDPVKSIVAESVQISKPRSSGGRCGQRRLKRWESTLFVAFLRLAQHVHYWFEKRHNL